MEPTSPPRRLSSAFWLVFPAPLVLGAAVLLIDRGHDAETLFGCVLILSFACALASAILLGRGLARTTGGKVALAFGSFVVLQIFYTVALIAGCSAVSGPMNMK